MHPHEPMTNNSIPIIGWSAMAAVADDSSPLAQHVNSSIAEPAALLWNTCRMSADWKMLIVF